MYVQPLLAKDAAHIIKHSVLSCGVMVVSLFYVLAHFVVLHHQAPEAQMTGEYIETPLSSSLVISNS